MFSREQTFVQTANGAPSPDAPTRSALDVANYFVKRSGFTKTPLQVQKMTYIAHGHLLAIKDRPLFRDKVEAWEYGPVIPSIYKAFKRWSKLPIGETVNYTEPQFDPDEFDVVDDVFKQYGKLCGYFLSQITHDDGKGPTPWRQCHRKGGKVVIPDHVTKAYYEELISA